MSAIMLVVLRSVAHGGTAGVREWSAANVAALVALPLFAARGHVPEVLAFDLANLMLLCAPVLMYIGFERHLGRRPPLGALALLLVVSTVALALLHYVVDLMAVRIALTSLCHGIVNAATAWGLRPAGRRQPGAPATPDVGRFAYCAAIALTVAYTVRFVLYAANHDARVTMFDTSPLNLICFTLGTLALPALTLGALMMANAGLLGQATYAAEHDYLTGAWSRRGFFTLAERERTHALRDGAALSMLLFDIDHFKAINDTYGHAAGDQVLADIVGRTTAALRGEGCARLGGEEFAVLLPRIGPDVALFLAEDLRAGLARARVATDAGAVGYTVSVGVASLADAESFASLMQRADAALYAAKRAGRNRVHDARTPERVRGDAARHA